MEMGFEKHQLFDWAPNFLNAILFNLMSNYWIIVVSSRWIRADAEGHSCSSGCSAVQAVSPLVRLPLSILRGILTLKYENRKV